jgi:hypothetical protein
MRRVLLAILVTSMLAAWVSTGLATSGSAVATASLRVKRRAVARLYWEDNGQASQDLGTVTPGTTITDNLILEIEDNPGFTQTFSVSVGVAQTGGTGWEGDVRISDGMESLSFSGGRFLPLRSFASPVDTPTDHVQQVLPVTIHVAPTQEAGSYQFEFTVNAASL